MKPSTTHGQKEEYGTTQRVYESSNESFSIVASAGCGKTYLLVKRVISLLERGIPIERLLLITFTENAAAEMKSRLLKELEQQDSKPWAKNAIENIHSSSIQTINSFCFEIVNTFYIDAGLTTPPSILDDIEFNQLLTKELSNFYKVWANKKDFQSSFHFLNALNIKRKHLVDLAYSLMSCYQDENKDAIQELKSFSTMDIDRINNKIEAIASQARIVESLITRELLENEKTNSRTRLLGFKNYCSAIVDSRSNYQSIRSIINTEKFITVKRFSIESRSQNEKVESEIDILRNLSTAFIEEAKSHAFEFIKTFLVEFLREFRSSRFRLGIISHDESVFLANELLGNESNRFDIWNRYSSILVDEFQDTDNTQISIINHLSQEGSEDSIGRLLVVGDEKQAIYGFRGATVDSYSEFNETTSSNIFPLNKNYRSTSQIIQFVNEMMDYFGDNYLHMESHRQFDYKSLPPVSTFGTEILGNATEVRNKTAQEIIDLIPNLLNTKIEKEGKLQGCQLSDIAVLFRDKNGIQELVKLCEENSIPFQVDGSTSIWEQDLLKIAISALSAIADPQDESSIVMTLKSPLFCCTNDELGQYVHSRLTEENYSRQDSMWNYANLNFSLHDCKVKNYLKQLKDIHKNLSTLKPNQALAQLLYDDRFLDSLPKDIASDYRQTINFLHSLAITREVRQTSNSLFDFVKYLQQLFSVKKSPIKLNQTNTSGALNIMTFHKSKGLEFPIVILCPSPTVNNSSEPKFLKSESGNNAVYINSNLFDSSIADQIKDLEESKRQEEIRLLYVGLTRAKDHLIMCTNRSSTKQTDKKYSGGVQLLMEGLRKVGKIPDLTIDRNNGEIDLSNNFPTTESSIEYIHVDPSRLVDKVSSSKTMAPSEAELDDISFESNLFINKANKSNLVGIATHHALNIIDFDASEKEIRHIAKLSCERYGIRYLDQKVNGLVVAALSSELLKGSKIKLREVPISAYIDDCLVEGYIDLLIQEEDGFIVVDYKTDTITDDNDLHNKINKYTPQLALYKRALEETHHMVVKQSFLLFLNYKGGQQVLV